MESRIFALCSLHIAHVQYQQCCTDGGGEVFGNFAKPHLRSFVLVGRCVKKFAAQCSFEYILKGWWVWALFIILVYVLLGLNVDISQSKVNFVRVWFDIYVYCDSEGEGR